MDFKITPPNREEISSQPTMSQIYSDRRHSVRYDLKIPLVFCPANTPISSGHSAESINVSSGGIFFMTRRRPVFVGLSMQLLFRMPRRVSGKLSSERVYAGRVTRVQRGNAPGGVLGVGVEFFHWEARPELAA